MSGGNLYYTELTTDISSLPPGTTTVHPTSTGDAIQTAAVAGLILARHKTGMLTYGTGMGLWPGLTDIYSNVDCPNLPGASCVTRDLNDYTHVYTYLSPSEITPAYPHSHWKIVIAHELGHSAQALGAGIQITNSTDNPSEPSCRCDQVVPPNGQLHCLQSREYSGTAQAEGFAHSFAVRLFNNWTDWNAGFKYYKKFRQDDGSILYPPFTRDGFNVQRWRINHCNLANRGVEWDWETFLYNVSAEYAAYPVSFYNLWDIYWAACGYNYCWSHDVTYTDLYNSAYAYWHYNLYEDHFYRFWRTASDHGVDN
jgi:hypothetical protein